MKPAPRDWQSRDQLMAELRQGVPGSSRDWPHRAHAMTEQASRRLQLPPPCRHSQRLYALGWILVFGQLALWIGQ